MTAVNGKTITYDQNGNPTNYVTYGDVEYYIEWENGRQLSYANCYEEQWQAEYRYDANGVRTYKNVDGYKSDYTTQNGKLVREVCSNRLRTYVLDFIYDESGRPFALNYSPNGDGNFTMYYYILNLQGDVVKLVTASGETVASYEYDAWGKVLSATGSMAEKNPLRYRGYYYDTETGFYYLQSRYYDPVNRRFINADSYSSTGQGFVGTNMFAYCNNNPVINVDPNGEIGIIGVIIGIVVVCATLAGCATEEEQNWPADCPYHYAPKGHSRTDPNCYTYAFEYGDVANPGDFSGISSYDDEGKFSLSMIRTAVLTDADARGIKVKECTVDPREFSPTNDAILIACKVSDDRTDYHFAALLPNGVWVDKPGAAESRYGVIDGFAKEWVCAGYTYNSDSLYFLYYR